MAIIESYSRQVPSGTWKSSDSLGNKASGAGSPSLVELTRDGIRRRKPSPLDETPYSRWQQTSQTPTGVRTQRDGSYTSVFTGPDDSFGLGGFAQYRVSGLGNTFNSNFADSARLKALRKLNLKDLDLGTAWKERGKTAQLVAGLAETSVDALRAIKRRSGRDLLNALGLDHSGARGRGWVDGYLAYQYGVKPLMLDVAGATQALARLPPGDWTVCAEGRVYEDSTKRSKIGGYRPYEVTSVYREGVKYKVAAHQRLLTREQDILWALGLDDPISTVYETTPYSFVLDWALPIGDWLQALNSVKYYDSWFHVTSQFLEEKTLFKPGSSTMGTAKIDNKSRGYWNTLNVKRSVSAGIPIIGLPCRNPVSVDHMAKGLSLLASTLANLGEPPRMLRY